MHRLIVTNDDGIEAPGLAALCRAAEHLGQIRVVAPAGPQSGCAHAVTTHRPVPYSIGAEGSIAVEGTPADCVRLALNHLVEDAEWVLSGINAGGNLGVDLFHSGTVAAVREAVIHGKSGVAISHYIAKGRTIDWDTAVRRVVRVLNQLLTQTWTLGAFWNVNLPHPEPGSREPEIVICPLDLSPLPLHYRIEGNTAVYDGDYQSRKKIPGSDVAVCFGGDISVTRIALSRC